MSKRRNFRFDDATEAKLQSLMVSWDMDATGVLKKLIHDADDGNAPAMIGKPASKPLTPGRAVKLHERRSKTNATIAPKETLYGGPAGGGMTNTLRRTIPKPKDRGLV